MWAGASFNMCGFLELPKLTDRRGVGACDNSLKTEVVDLNKYRNEDICIGRIQEIVYRLRTYTLYTFSCL